MMGDAVGEGLTRRDTWESTAVTRKLFMSGVALVLAGVEVALGAIDTGLHRGGILRIVAMHRLAAADIRLVFVAAVRLAPSDDQPRIRHAECDAQAHDRDEKRLMELSVL
jgi:hypothetical protein